MLEILANIKKHHGVLTIADLIQAPVHNLSVFLLHVQDTEK